MATWTDHVTRWRNCKLCALGCQRANIVLARGSIPADIAFIGEAPGSSEDTLGLPFKGPAGRMLDSIVERAVPWLEIGTRTFNPSCVFCNLVACYPRSAKTAGTNNPEPDEIRACMPRLREFIDLCRPKLIVCVGDLAERYVPEATGGTYNIAGDVVGHATIQRWCKIVHPSFILSKMPLAQQGYAVQKSVVKIASAIDLVEF